ncbi:hypothetical protein VOLCADRAFT_94796 [Volvox carteri f. nagariensis]|uniref:Uncharacterized protein n=1 Tax=Volvox carteri f. nagariensis TaxID=3068 RepID=D8U5S7_VOLCA|nr:uncharacterized protein VOLCADRAFT_94796 [Volvox carteri f. nagariensis]EFJ45052.1 hypothetical protein VOLCADRAFT_94796 [Volvox carteri f. nagariensis]|eukprot:XP_002954023.1 hypothetical protein VOLCADRAFT_94796 [Volvox carteri f. nagariensis]
MAVGHNRPICHAPTTPTTTPAFRGPARYGTMIETEPELRREQLRNAMAVEGANVVIWLLASLLIYLVVTKQALTSWLLLPPLREACKGASNVINYAVELMWVWRDR